MTVLSRHTWYVDDILIIFNHERIRNEEILSKVNSTHKNLEFKITKEERNKIVFLDLEITRNEHNLELNI
jgi:hypothetical protein